MTSTRGQILPMALVCILLTVLFWISLLNIGKLIKDRLQLQVAADTAAQSACAIRARGLNSIGLMNRWLGTPVIGIGAPYTAWWPDAARAQKKFIRMVQTLQEAYNRAYGGGRAAARVRTLAQEQGADDIYVPANLYSLQLQRNHGPILYLSTRHVYVEGVPIPYPALPPQILDKDPGTLRWYEQGPDFHKKTLRAYAYRRGDSLLNGAFPLARAFLQLRRPDLYAIAAARVYNPRGPMFPEAQSAEGLTAGVEAQRAYEAASPRWRSQLVPIGGHFEH